MLATGSVALAATVIGGKGLVAAQDASPIATPGAAASLIFYLGDGMGQAHRDAGQLYFVGAYETQVMDSLPVVGMIGTNSVTPDALITDSAAAATSYATGVKTLNGAVGMDAASPLITVELIPWALRLRFTPASPASTSIRTPAACPQSRRPCRPLPACVFNSAAMSTAPTS